MDDSASETLGQRTLLEYPDHPKVRQFINQISADNTEGQLISFTFPVPQFDPLACLEMLSPTDEFNFYWEKPDQELALSAGGEVSTLQATGNKRFQDISDQLAEVEQRTNSFSLIPHSLSGIHFLGGFSFFDDLKSEWWKPFGSARMTIPRWTLIREGKLGLLTITLQLHNSDTPGSISDKLETELSRFEELFHPAEDLATYEVDSLGFEEHFEYAMPPEADWIESVENAQELILKNQFKKIVLSREVNLQSEQEIIPTHVLNTLRNQYPSCYSFMIQNEDGKAFLGCSPERLVSFQKNYLLTESLAGSISRGKTATEDVHLEKYLLKSSKNRQEHQYVTSAIEDNLQPFIKKIERAEQPDVKKLKNVQHLYTPVRAWLKEDIDRFSILEKLHPTPAVGGYPREEAVPYIKDLEQFDRGWYAGPVGWFNLNGGGEFAVAIRSTLVEGNSARVFAGCGIVQDSDPYAEWEETNLKLMPILSALETNDRKPTE